MRRFPCTRTTDGLGRTEIAATVGIWLAVAALLGAVGGCGSPANETPPGFAVLGTTIPADAAEATIPEGWRERAPKTNRILPELTEAEQARGYIIFAKPYLDKVYPGTRPARVEITDRVSASSVPGEYEPVTFTIYALKDLHGVRVAVDDLTGPGGTAIEAGQIDVRSVRCMPRVVWQQSVYVLRPTLLEKRDRIDILKGTSQRFWITVRVPANSAAGQYRGRIRVQGEDLADGSLEFALDVLPIRLLTPPTYHGMYCSPVDLTTGPNYRLLPAEQLRKDIVNMKEHGMNTVFVSIPPVCESVKEAGKVHFDLEPFRPLAELCQQAGFKAIILNTSISEFMESPLGDFPTMLKAFADGYAQQGWPTLIYSVGDESDANGTLGRVLPMLAQLKQAMPEVTTYSTIVMPEKSEVLGPNLDIRAFSSYVDDTVVEKTRKAGAQLWQYSGSSGYGLDPKGDRLYRGIWSAKLGMVGVMDWTYWRPALDISQPFNDLIGGRNNMTCWVFPGADGPLSSPGWEAIREGIEDEKYIFTLKTLIERARKSTSRPLKTQADHAERYLAKLYAKVNTSPRRDDKVFPISREAARLDASFYDDMRRGIARHILTLDAK